MLMAVALGSRPKPSSPKRGRSQRSRVTLVARSPAGSLASSAWNAAQAPCSSVQDLLMASRSRRPGGEVVVLGPCAREEVWLLDQQAEQVGGKETAFSGDRGERAAGCHVRRAGRGRRRGRRLADGP